MTPDHLAALLIVVSGAAHAMVNAILKAGQDKMASRALIDGISALLILPAAFLVPLPTGAWLWLFASALVHLVYLLCLIKAFEGADMSVAYPIMRGSAPALAALVAVGVFGEPITPPVVVGVALVSAGVMTVGLGHHAQRRAILWALATGSTIALYTVIDAQGVRAAPTALSYIAWIYLAMGGGIALLFALWRGRAFFVTARRQWRPGLAAGALSIVTYGLALWAYRLGDTPRLAALRETSILFALVIAVVFLKERPSAGRLGGALAVGAGAAVLLVTS
jgi:drug/metabolite transporter (DMT)-like permease